MIALTPAEHIDQRLKFEPRHSRSRSVYAEGRANAEVGAANLR